MPRFLQLHLLTTYPAANLNRDDTGRPKTVLFGGAERLRISSQSLKRAFRTSAVFADGLPGALGTRSQAFAGALVDALVARGLTREDAVARAEAVITVAKLGKVKKGAVALTEQLVHLGPDELEAIAGLAERMAQPDALEEKSILVLKDKPRAADIAMFGRMLADNPVHNIEAAVQVAHAFTTHRAVVEDDYYTAVDDIKNADQAADRGAGFIGVQEFGAGLFYLYICVDAGLLLDNLAGDAALAADAVAALVRAATTVSPGGKQNAYASRAKARYALLETGDEAPRSLAGAFQLPVGARPGEADQYQESVARLTALRDGFRRAYDEDLASHVMDVDDPGSASLADLIAAARAAVTDAAASAPATARAGA
ncbi:type I-E CRISPR-associated protein Cas7/Cse4/CasC [Nitrospirillum sp. BR 11828]|uniref:type I-E CRISPR-associated protein Cas7/Cse4/CasC n=1 Tax=Nitrospirillum sp. BR 11828 TaxID=3104325 RepID=UPI002ACA8429|nr:type I-E CRISPR-associated protein Cas7/Cse4/CasC [Nitrospirillum sp. BR 11828]MDZ5649989.1 type I-E CRISPR-associated protein Cas7/Cse4/CasC [Nitrospirillum sp. BR 11828]